MQLKKNLKRTLIESLVIIILLLVLTLPFFFTDLDVNIQNRYYSADKGEWYLADASPWRQLRDYSALPALLVSLTAMFIYILGLNLRKYEKYRKICLYLVLMMIIAPGLIINLGLKDNFGRPRPRHITQFGGDYRYEKPLAYDGSSPGKSFPCGHASMGFYFFAFYILFRGRKRFLAAAGILAALLWGGLIGFTRILQGGHFLSDSLWSAAICYLTALWLYYLFGFHKGIYYHSEKKLSSGGKKLRTAIASISVVLILIGVLLATPVDKKHEVKYDQNLLQNSRIIELNMELYRAEVEISKGDSLSIRWEYSGFGPPKSRLRSLQEESKKDSVYNLQIKQYATGFFTEFQQKLSILLPSDKKTHLRYTNGDEIFDKTYN